IGQAIVPRYPGVTSAMGCVIADMRQDFVQTINALTATLDTSALRATMQDHVDQGMSLLDAAKSRFQARTVRFELDMAYVGQTHTVAVPLSVPVAECNVADVTVAEVEAAFDDAYKATYGRLLTAGTRRVMNLRTAVIGERPKFDLSSLAPGGGDLALAGIGTRPVHFGDRWHDTAIFDRLALPVGAEIDGPAILVQPDTTVLIDPDLTGRIDAYGNTIIARKDG
ncbi:MAG: hydantoinase/oxoprolinase family protein, partial [Pseudomonadota bacterium]